MAIISSRFSDEDSDWIDRFAKRRGLSRSESLRQAVLVLQEIERSHFRYEKKKQASASFRAQTAEVG